MAEDSKTTGVSLSVGTIQFLVQLGVLLSTIMAFGFTIKAAVEVQAVKQDQQQKQIESLEKKIELMRYDLGGMQTDIGIIKSGRWRPLSKGDEQR